MANSSTSAKVAEHYNEMEEKGLEARTQSPIFYLRNFNNWVKSMLINEYLQCIGRENNDRKNCIHVLDLGCGKGGDVLKWKTGKVDHVVFTDIAEKSVQACKERYKSLRAAYTAEFISLDCSKDLIRDKLQNKDNPIFDLVSSQFVIHYTFESCERIMIFLRNVSEMLRIGGYFIGTTINSSELICRCRNAPNQTISNDIFKIAFDKNTMDLSGDIPLFNAKYDFSLHEVVNCEEYLVYFPLLIKLAEKHGLEFVDRKTFTQFFSDQKSARVLLEKMKALEAYSNKTDVYERIPLSADHVQYEHAVKYLSSLVSSESASPNQNTVSSCRTLSMQEWEITSLYITFAFKKTVMPASARSKLIAENNKNETPFTGKQTGRNPKKRPVNEDDDSEDDEEKSATPKKRAKQRSPQPSRPLTTTSLITKKTTSRVKATVSSSSQPSHSKSVSNSNSSRLVSRSPPPQIRAAPTKSTKPKTTSRSKSVKRRSSSSSNIALPATTTKTSKKGNETHIPSYKKRCDTWSLPNLDNIKAASNTTIRKTRIAHPTKLLTVNAATLKVGGQVLALGENGMRQLGLSANIPERQNAQPVAIPEKVIQIAAGPMHSAVLTDKNQIYSFGCNDEKALGHTENDDEDSDDESEVKFGSVDFTKIITNKNEQIIQVVAGDSHTMILTNVGKVYGWGTFRSSTNGPFGLITKNKIESEPVEIPLPEKIIKIASGHDFVLFLSETGCVYSSGNGETGQLGRISRYSAEYSRHGGTERLLTPAPIEYNRKNLKEKQLVFSDIFASAHGFFLKAEDQNISLGCGLNNFHQLGFESTEPIFFPTYIPSLDGHEWIKFSGGLHHTLALAKDGSVFSFGRHYEGQLGIENIDKHLSEPTRIDDVPKAVDISCGNHVSFVIDENGKAYSFGGGASLQHGHGQRDVKKPEMISSKYMDIKSVQMVAVGSQHTLFLVFDK
ncbi:unnamed protein product [Didymodactylos carnosus]|uniref:mRNA (guanine-N(7))-methyltransferase n=2 Tax=Didymodactylos carnosus TaxID=1234261 RepID=A0A814WVV6_9BILA|nr:unnamed protein product [Didymodactylos carnosus]CAF3971210.1 unnamed protein product [Didymodactylos carnosus]